MNHTYYSSQFIHGETAKQFWLDLDDVSRKVTHGTLSDSHRTAAVSHTYIHNK